MVREIESKWDKILQIFANRNSADFSVQLLDEKIGFLTRIFTSTDMIVTFQVPSINIFIDKERKILIAENTDESVITCYILSVSIHENKPIIESENPDMDRVNKHFKWLMEIKDLSNHLKIISELKQLIPFEQRSPAGEDISIFINPHTEDLILSEITDFRIFTSYQKRFLR